MTACAQSPLAKSVYDQNSSHFDLNQRISAAEEESILPLGTMKPSGLIDGTRCFLRHAALPLAH
jgi:hypothetical protein